jgi:aminoglycoside phosphotransferase family enzyme/predicted kinase
LNLPADAEIRQTHISTVYLTADRAFKTKRPVSLGFVDYSTRELRRAACEAEVSLNRRLAPDVYLGVVELADGEPAVEMVRLRDEDSLLARLDRGQVDTALIRRVGQVLGAFHAAAPRSDAISDHGSPERFAHHVRENFEQARDHVPELCHPELFARVQAASLDGLVDLVPALESRGRAGRIRDGHGDLRLEHVYVDDAGAIRVIDGVEFNDRYRCGDVALDLAFLVMDLRARSAWDLAASLVSAWSEVTGDDVDALLPPLVAYRSLVRAKVAGFTLRGVEGARRAALIERARRHWSLAWGELAPERPVLGAVGGRPGSGKSTVCRSLAGPVVEVIRSDVVRKALAGVAEDQHLAGGAYTASAKDRVYAACLDRAEQVLARGDTALIDATFTQDRWRRALLPLALRWAVPVGFLRCEAPRAVVAERLTARVGDASDADLAVYDASTWEAESPEVAARTTPLDTTTAATAAAAAWLASIRAPRPSSSPSS